MSFASAFALTARLSAFAVLLQAVEILWALRSTAMARIWSRRNLETELNAGLPLPRFLIARLASDRALPVLAAVQAAAAAAGLFFVSPWIFAALLAAHVLVCIRFRGSFGGGADTMTVIVLTGLLIASLAPGEGWGRLGLVYIAIHLLYSYAKAGFSKLIHREWRDGTALPVFLGRSFYPDVRVFGAALARAPFLSLSLGWALLVFEMSAPAAPFFPAALRFYFLAAVLLHFAIHLVFGLNRFFWIWLCAWPSVFYLSSLL